MSTIDPLLKAIFGDLNEARDPKPHKTQAEFDKHFEAVKGLKEDLDAADPCDARAVSARWIKSYKATKTV